MNFLQKFFKADLSFGLPVQQIFFVIRLRNDGCKEVIVFLQDIMII